ncbi:alpha/beta hydrolase [Alteromonas sediminis]|uniref:Alpha/beta hydrolase n=1 Tax=Alteromonas sediminis TaxID=2259342 RepID=A0A3N5Z8J7_9ALTE|nr:alpha/beta family hydrolase [Alteromonas sediminis]RPJ67184.1 alpha/beta hydrolase [Alteromonas sediminis]
MSSKLRPMARLLLTHGAGAPVESDFMRCLAEQLSQHGIEVITFNFSYMQRQLNEGKKRPPSRAPILEEEFAQHIDNTEQDGIPLFIGGKSMGGRIATHMLANPDFKGRIQGAVVYGYPFHPPGKPEKLRLAHFAHLHCPLLILQGERDTFGNKKEIETFSLSSQVSVDYLADGDHSFKPRKASGFTQNAHIALAAKKTISFVRAHRGRE